MQENDKDVKPLAYGIAEALKVVPIGRSFLYEEIKAGRLRTFRIGKRRVIAFADLQDWLDRYRAEVNAMVKRGRRSNPTGRSFERQYTSLPYNMTGSRAWQSLSGNAIMVLIALKCKFNGSNNGKLSLPYAATCKQLGIGRATLKRAFDELQDKGFIRLIKQGRWYGRMAAEWATTDKHYNGNSPTNEWKTWQPSATKK